MTLNKGDLVLVSDGERTSTCIILTEQHNSAGCREFFYTYCVESGLYGIIYKKEILSIVAKGFAPDFGFENELFDTNYKYYPGLYENFSYFPSFYPYGLDIGGIFDDEDGFEGLGSKQFKGYYSGSIDNDGEPKT